MAETTEKLFTGQNFFLRPCEQKERIRKLVEENGGLMVKAKKKDVIRLSNRKEDTEGVHIDYIIDSCEQKQLQDLNIYELPGYGHPNVTATHMKVDPTKLAKSRQHFDPEEDDAIMQYITKYSSEAGSVGSKTGNNIFKVMEEKKITLHTWQSMKARYINYLQHREPEFQFNPIEMRMNASKEMIAFATQIPTVNEIVNADNSKSIPPTRPIAIKSAAADSNKSKHDAKGKKKKKNLYSQKSQSKLSFTPESFNYVGSNSSTDLFQLISSAELDNEDTTTAATATSNIELRRSPRKLIKNNSREPTVLDELRRSPRKAIRISQDVQACGEQKKSPSTNVERTSQEQGTLNERRRSPRKRYTSSQEMTLSKDTFKDALEDKTKKSDYSTKNIPTRLKNQPQCSQTNTDDGQNETERSERSNSCQISKPDGGSDSDDSCKLVICNNVESDSNQVITEECSNDTKLQCSKNTTNRETRKNIISDAESESSLNLTRQRCKRSNANRISDSDSENSQNSTRRRSRRIHAINDSDSKNSQNSARQRSRRLHQANVVESESSQKRGEQKRFQSNMSNSDTESESNQKSAYIKDANRIKCSELPLANVTNANSKIAHKYSPAKISDKPSTYKNIRNYYGQSSGEIESFSSPEKPKLLPTKCSTRVKDSPNNSASNLGVVHRAIDFEMSDEENDSFDELLFQQAKQTENNNNGDESDVSITYENTSQQQKHISTSVKSVLSTSQESSSTSVLSQDSILRSLEGMIELTKEPIHCNCSKKLKSRYDKAFSLMTEIDNLKEDDPIWDEIHFELLIDVRDTFKNRINFHSEEVLLHIDQTYFEDVCSEVGMTEEELLDIAS